MFPKKKKKKKSYGYNLLTTNFTIFEVVDCIISTQLILTNPLLTIMVLKIGPDRPVRPVQPGTDL